MKNINRYISSFFLLLFCFVACKSDHNDLGHISVRLNEDPDGSLPYFARNAAASQVLAHLYLPCADFDPSTLELKPVLVESIPESFFLNKYTFRIRKNAKWSDGKSITSEDILFTVKYLLNPYSEFKSYASKLKTIKSIIQDKSDLLKFEVEFDDQYHYEEENFLNLAILPSHALDSFKVLNKYSIDALKSKDIQVRADSTILNSLALIGKKISSEMNQIPSSGPYIWGLWKKNQLLELHKIKKYWGGSLSHLVLFEAIPDKIRYLILADNNSSISALSNGNLDILSDLQPADLKTILQSDASKSKYNVNCIEQMQYFYVCLNNLNPILQDVLVRKALAHCLDRSNIINSLMDGKGTIINSPILPQKKYYLETPSLKFDISEASKKLKLAGWKLNQKSNILEKVIEGKNTALELNILTTGKLLGRSIAEVFKNECAKIGIRIKIEIIELNVILERLKTGHFDMANVANKMSPGMDDPYISWHSSQIGSTNYSRLNNTEIDNLCEKIRRSKLPNEQKELYKAFQVKLAEQQPVLFLFWPQNCIISSKKIALKTSLKRPGYFENSVK